MQPNDKSSRIVRVSHIHAGYITVVILREKRGRGERQEGGGRREEKGKGR
jgi:hypothetical protein